MLFLVWRAGPRKQRVKKRGQQPKGEKDFEEKFGLETWADGMGCMHNAAN